MQMNTSYIYRTGTALLLLLAAAAGAPAQERWSLKQCIDHAIANNITIRQTANQAEQSRVDVNTAKWARLPSLNGSAGQSWSWGRSQTAVADEETGEYNTVYVNTKNNNTSLSVSTSIPLFTGLQIPNEYALAKLNLQASLADLAKAKEDIAINIASAYLQVLFNSELHGVAQGQADLSREQLARIESLAGVGKASPSEVAEARARVAQDELQVVQTDNDYRLALLDLAQLIELDTPEGFLVEEPAADVVEAPLTPPDEIYQMALADKPGTSYYSTLNRSFSQQMQDNFSKYVGFSLSVPLFNRLSTRNRVRTARLQRENYALQLDEAKKTLYKEIQQAWYNAAAAISRYHSSRAATAASDEAFRLTRKKYECGQANAVEYNEARQNLMSAQSDELQAKYEYLFRVKILDFYQGTPIQ